MDVSESWDKYYLENAKTRLGTTISYIILGTSSIDILEIIRAISQCHVNVPGTLAQHDVRDVKPVKTRRFMLTLRGIVA